jgi:hypothetical protein
MIMLLTAKSWNSWSTRPVAPKRYWVRMRDGGFGGCKQGISLELKVYNAFSKGSRIE